jgi:hypothetical protein
VENFQQSGTKANQEPRLVGQQIATFLITINFKSLKFFHKNKNEVGPHLVDFVLCLRERLSSTAAVYAATIPTSLLLQFVL